MLNPNQEHQVLIPIVGHLKGDEYVTSESNWQINAKLKLFMQTNTIMLNTSSITKSVAEFPVKGFGLSPQDFSKLKVEVPQRLSWLNTSMSKQTQVYIQLSTSISSIKGC